MKRNFWLRLLFVLVVVVFFGNQIYSSLYKPIHTESASFYEAVDGLHISGLILRNEQLVSSPVTGVYHFVTSDGARVAKGGVIANIYDNEKASLTMSEIDSLTAQISDVTELQGYNNLQASDLDLVNGRIDSAMNELIRSCSAGNYNVTAECESNLLSLMNRRQMITGQMTDFSGQLSVLNQRLAELKKGLPSAKGSIRAEKAGYFSSSTDGFETVLSGIDPNKITVDFLQNLASKPVDAGVIGKIVSDYEWYIAARVTINDSLKYKVGDALTIRTELHSDPVLDVSVKAINLADDGDNAVVVFSCNRMSSALASMRSGPMTVINSVHTGLRVAKSALRVVDGQTGVYVLSGITLKFVPVNVLYSQDDYILCEQQQSDSDVLRLYDEVVTKGKKLYDGKVVG